MPLQVGSVLGPFRLDAELGRGGMGVVFRATDLRAGRAVALKAALDPSRAAAITRFVREAQVVASLRHPGIVLVHDANVFDGVPCIVYELVEGGRTLGDLFRDGLLVERLEAVCEVADALAYAHDQGLVHRDVKPGNVLIDAEGRARLTDFGLVTGEELDRLTRSGAMAGTLSHMAPEQIAADRDAVGAHSDVWALGVLLYQALTGSLPFQGTAVEVMVRARGSKPTPPSSISDEPLPRGAQAVCLRALSKAPADRYRDAGAFRDALVEVLEGRYAVPGSWGRVAAALAVLLGGVALGVGAAARLSTPEAANSKGPAASAAASPEAERTVEDWRGLAAKRARAHRYRSAIAALDEVLSRRPDDLLALRARARAWTRLGDHPRAAVDLRRCLELDPDDGESYYRLLAGDWAQRRRFDGAPDLDRPVDGADGLHYRALARQRANRLVDALKDYSAVVELRPRDGRSLNNRANVRSALGDVRGALADCRRAVELDPLPKIRLNLITMLLRTEQEGAALSAADALIRDRPKDAKAHLARAWARRLLKDYPGAAADIAAARESGASEERALQEEALLLEARGEQRRAREAYRRLLEIAPENRIALINNAALAIKAKELKRAEELLRRARRLAPDDERSLANLATLLAESGRLAEAHALAQQAVEQAPQRPKLRLPLAFVLVRQGKIREAVEVLDAALKLDPALARAHLIRGKLLVRLKRWGEAEAAFSAALKHDPGMVEARMQRGVLYLNTERFRSAQRDFDGVIEARPRVGAWVYRGHCRLKLGDSAGAVADYGRALKVDPKNVDALNNRSYLHTQAKRHAAAAADLIRLTRLRPTAARYWYLLAIERRALRQHREGLADCRRYRRLAPRDVDGVLLEARLCLELRRLPEVHRALAPLLKRRPNDLKALALRADALQQEGRWAEVVTCFERILTQFEPGSPQAERIRKALKQARARVKRRN